MKRFLYPADGAGGNDVKGNKEWAWEEIILCEDLAKEFESTLEGVKEEAWRRGVELGIVKLVSTKDLCMISMFILYRLLLPHFLPFSPVTC